MSEHWEIIRDELLAIVKGEAADAWNPADEPFVKERAAEIAKLSVSLTVAPDDAAKEAIRQEIRVEKASMLLRIDQAILRGGNAFKSILKRVFSVVMGLLQSKLTALIRG